MPKQEYDPSNVGLVVTPGVSNRDVSFYANSNQGHEYGVGLSETEKRDLIEYLKSLSFRKRTVAEGTFHFARSPSKIDDSTG